MSGNHLTCDGEFRYIVQWFNEWTELQRDDFLPVLVEYLTKDGVVLNGIITDLAGAAVTDKPPMSLFQCRIKLFRQWTPKWPPQFKTKIGEKVAEIDTKFGDKLKDQLKTTEDDAAPAAAEPQISNGHAEESVAVEVEAVMEEEPIVQAVPAIVTTNGHDAEATTNGDDPPSPEEDITPPSDEIINGVEG